MKVKNSIYSRMFQAYTFEHGIQVIQFQCFSLDELERFVKMFSCRYFNRKLYVHEVFTIHRNYLV